MTCIDCGLAKSVTIHQERRVFSRTCSWEICVECLQAYERVTADIAREREAKALGKLAHGKSATPKRPTNDNANQGRLA